MSYDKCHYWLTQRSHPWWSHLNSTINNKMQWVPIHPHMWMENALPLLRILWFFWLDCCGCDSNSGFCDKVWVMNQLCFFELYHQWNFWATFIGVVPMDFMEVRPLTSVLLCLPISLNFLWLGMVVLRLTILWVRDSFTTLWLLWICRTKFSHVLLL